MISLIALLNMAEQGDAGEAANARRILDKLLVKYDMSIDDIRSPEIANYSFRYKNRFEKSLLIQVVGKVLDVTTVYHDRKPGCKKLTFKLTQSQAIDINSQYPIYLRELRQLMDDTLTAFISKNYIYGESDVPRSTTTEEELKKWERIANISQSLDVVPIHKELT